MAIESDVDEPEKSGLFNRFPGILKNRRAMAIIADTLRMVMTTTIATHELEALLENEIDTHYEELISPSKTVSFIADAHARYCHVNVNKRVLMAAVFTVQRRRLWVLWRLWWPS